MPTLKKFKINRNFLLLFFSSLIFISVFYLFLTYLRVGKIHTYYTSKTNDDTDNVISDTDIQISENEEDSNSPRDIDETEEDDSQTPQIPETDDSKDEATESQENEPTPPPPGSCPQVTKNCVRCKIGEHPHCRALPGDEYGYLGWACQNNDPSNIYYASFKVDIIKQMGGPTPCGNRGGYIAFKTYDEGYRGVKAYIKAINAGLHSAYITADFQCGNCTLLQFFSKYAPGGDGGATYTNKVVNRMGGTITTETKLSWIVSNRLNDLVDAIQCNEGFYIEVDGATTLWCRI